MRAVLTRVDSASVAIDGKVKSSIGKGFLILLGVHEDDGEAEAVKIADKICGLRVFEDENGKMNLSLADVGGSILAVSQFTLYGDARGGRRPSFIAAARPEAANALYEQLVGAWRERGFTVETGRFRTDMQVHLTNDGPVTLLLDSTRLF